MIRIAKIAGYRKCDVNFDPELIGRDGKLDQNRVECSMWVGDNTTVEVNSDEMSTHEYTFSVISVATEQQCVDVLNSVIEEHCLSAAVDLYEWIKELAYRYGEDSIIPVYNTDDDTYRTKGSYEIRAKSGFYYEFADTIAAARYIIEEYEDTDKENEEYEENSYEIYDTIKGVVVE